MDTEQEQKDRPSTNKIIHLGYSAILENCLYFNKLLQGQQNPMLLFNDFSQIWSGLYLGGDKSVICEILRSYPKINKSLL